MAHAQKLFLSEMTLVQMFLGSHVTQSQKLLWPDKISRKEMEGINYNQNSKKFVNDGNTHQRKNSIGTALKSINCKDENVIAATSHSHSASLMISQHELYKNTDNLSKETGKRSQMQDMRLEEIDTSAQHGHGSFDKKQSPEVLEVYFSLQDQERKRHQDAVKTELENINMRVEKILMQNELMNEPPKADKVTPSTASIMTLAAYDTRMEREKLNERLIITERINQFQLKSIEREQYLRELMLWFDECCKHLGDVVTPEEMTIMISNVQQLHEVISQSLDQFMKTGEKIVEKGQAFIEMTDKMFEGKREPTVQQKAMVKKKMPVFDDLALLSNPAKWDQSIKTIISVFEESYKQMKNNQIKTMVHQGQQQFEFMMTANSKFRFELEERKAECAELKKKLASAGKLCDKLKNDIEEHRSTIHKSTVQHLEMQVALESLERKNKDVKDVQQKTKLLNSQIQIIESDLTRTVSTQTKKIPLPPITSNSSTEDAVKQSQKVLDSSTELHIHELEGELSSAKKEINSVVDQLNEVALQLELEKEKTEAFQQQLVVLRHMQVPDQMQVPMPVGIAGLTSTEDFENIPGSSYQDKRAARPASGHFEKKGTGVSRDREKSMSSVGLNPKWQDTAPSRLTKRQEIMSLGSTNQLETTHVGLNAKQQGTTPAGLNAKQQGTTPVGLNAKHQGITPAGLNAKHQGTTPADLNGKQPDTTPVDLSKCVEAKVMIDAEKEIHVLKDHVENIKSSDANLRKMENQYKEQLANAQKDTVRILRGIMHFRDHMIECLQKENLMDQVQALNEQSDFQKDKSGAELTVIPSGVVPSILSYMYNMENVLSSSFSALKMIMKYPVDKIAHMGLSKGMQDKANTAVSIGIKRNKDTLMKSCKETTLISKDLSKAIKHLTKTNSEIERSSADRTYQNLLQRYQVMERMYHKLQKEMEQLQNDVYSTIKKDKDADNNMVVVKQIDNKQKQEQEKKPDFTLDDQIQNLSILQQAFETNKIPKRVFKVAEAMIMQSIEMPISRIACFFDQYITYRKMRKIKGAYAQILAEQPVRVSYRIKHQAEKIEKKLRNRIKESRQKMKELTMQNVHLNDDMYKMVNEILLETGILLVNPLVRGENKRNLLQQAVMSISKNQMKSLLVRRKKGLRFILEMPDKLMGTSIPLQHKHGDSELSIAFPPSRMGFGPGIVVPHMLEYDVNKARICAVRAAHKRILPNLHKSLEKTNIRSQKSILLS